MCGRFAQYAPMVLSELAESVLDELDPDLELAGTIHQREPRYNLAPTMHAAVMARNADRRLEVKGLRWGLIPSWAKDKKIGAHGINARMETVARKPMFRTAFRKRRCVVPMNGYFEWKPSKDGKQPYFIHSPAQEALLCAGIWEAWQPGDDPEADWLRSFALLTGGAGIVSGNIHDRQPVIVPGEGLRTWLDGTPDEASRLLQQLPETELSCDPVSRAVGSVKNQGADLVTPLDV